jgi:hypothetical protein
MYASSPHSDATVVRILISEIGNVDADNADDTG